VKRTSGIGRWVVLEVCPVCRDRFVSARVRDRIVTCGACGALSWVVEEELTR
jgi:ribosomal protein S27AE